MTFKFSPGICVNMQCDGFCFRCDPSGAKLEAHLASHRPKEEQTIYRIKHGSHLYGTNTESSDEDFKEVYVPGGRDILLQRIVMGRASGPVKEANEKNKAGDIDTQAFAVSKLFKMLTSGDIIGCELIFTPPQNVLFKHPKYDMILENKDIFLSKKVDGYLGYCKQQANKYGIRGSRISSCRGLLELMKSLPGNDKIGDHWQKLASYCDATEHCSTIDIANTGTGTMMPHIECCSKKAPQTQMIKEAAKIFQLYFDNYGHRALLAEKNEGIDWKAMSHAVRVGHQAIELLATGNITFPRPEAAELLAIKKGEKPYKEVSDYLDSLFEAVKCASMLSSLPEEADQEAINELIVHFHKEMV